MGVCRNYSGDKDEAPGLPARGFWNRCRGAIPLTSIPVYPAASSDAPPEHRSMLVAEGNHPTTPTNLNALGHGDPLGTSGGEARSAEGAQPPTREEREISTRFGSRSTAEAQAGVGKEGSQSENAKSSEARTARWQALGILWDMSTLERVRKCGRVPVLPGGCVGVRKKVRKKSEAVGYAGLATCGSVWACPRCSAKIMAVRRLELGALIAEAADQ